MKSLFFLIVAQKMDMNNTGSNKFDPANQLKALYFYKTDKQIWHDTRY